MLLFADSQTSFNSSFHECFSACHPAPSSNVIMQELKKKNVKILSEKVLLLLNRGGKKKMALFYFCF